MTIIQALNGTAPWFVPESIGRIAELIPPDALAFEWGCGGSTLWLAQRCVSVLSVEHNREWHAKTAKELASYGLANVELVHVAEGDTFRAREYADVILRFPVGHFDLVFVDGRNRAACLERAGERIKPGAVLVLDNSERAQYQEAMHRFDGWGREDFFSGNSEGWTTTLWVKPV